MDWDQDGDTDVLVGAGPGETIWFHERLSNESFIPHQLLHLPKRGPEIPKGYLDSWSVGKRDQVWDEYLNSTFRFDVADWDGDSKKIIFKHVFQLFSSLHVPSSISNRIHGPQKLFELL